MINLFSLKKNESAEFDIKRDAFVLVLFLTVVVSFVLTIFSFIFSYEIQVSLVLIATFILSIIVGLLYKKTLNHELLCVILFSFILGITLSTFIIHGDKTRGSTPIWFAGVAIAFFFSVNIKKYWWVLISLFYLDTYLYVEYYIWTDAGHTPEDPFGFFIGVCFSFIAVCVGLIIIVYLQERNIRVDRDEKEQNREVVKNAGAAKSRFLANMSHEIRTPMNSIIGMSELILKDEMGEAERLEVITIRESAYDLLDIIDNVLMYSKLESGKMSLMLVDYKPDVFMKDILDSIANPIQEKKLELKIKIDPSMPKVLRGDDLKIRQIFIRLLFISIQLTDSGRIMIEINCERDEERNVAIFTGYVSDTGAGLSQADLNAIYGAYDKYDSRQNSNLKGISLKFAICKKLLEMMNGTLNITSIEGVGLQSKFRFECDVVDPAPMVCLENKEQRNVLIYVSNLKRLENWKDVMAGFAVRPDYANTPYGFEKAVKNKKYDFIFLSNVSYDSISDMIPKYAIENEVYVIAGFHQNYGDFGKCKIIRPPVTCITVSEVLNNRWKAEDYVNKFEKENIDGKNAKILVVDDNSVNLKVAAGIFKNYNINIDVAKSGEECIKKLTAVQYDLVLMDMVMPEMSGPETLQKIREADISYFKTVPIVALTASTGPNVREEIIQMGFHEYLAKPIKQRYLKNVLKQFLPDGLLTITYGDEKTAEIKEEPVKLEEVPIISDSQKHEEASVVFSEPQEETANPNEGLDEEKISIEVLESLVEKINKMKLKECEKIISDLTSKNYGKDINIKIQKIKSHYEKFDFHSVKEELAEIMRIV